MNIKSQLKDAQLEIRASGPRSKKGAIAFDSADKKTKVYDSDAVRTLVDTETAQTITTKTIDADSNTISNVRNANIASDAAIDYSKLNIADADLTIAKTSGLQAALDEKALDSDLTAHEAATSVHGVSGSVVGTTDTQAISNKTITASKNDDFLEIKEVTTPTTPASGYRRVYPKSDGKLYHVNAAGVEKEIGSGGSGQGETNYSANPYYADDASGVSSSSGDLTFAVTAISGEVQFPSISAQSLKVSKAAADCEDAFITLDSITLDPAYQKSGMAVVKLQVDTTIDSNFVNESFKIIVTDPNDSDREVSRAGGTLIQSNSSTEYQVLIDIPPTATELDTRVVCVSSNATAYDFIIGKHVVGELSQASIEGENIYTAVIANNGTATITSQSQTFIASVNRASIGNVDITFVSGFFSVVPAVVATKSGSQENIRITNKTTSGCTITIRNDSGTFFDGNFDLVVGRQGADFQESNYATNFELGLQAVYASAYQTSNQSIANNADIGLSFGVIEEDPFGVLDADGIFTAPRNGRLSISSTVVLTDTAWVAGELSKMLVYKNGSLYAQIYLKECEANVTKFEVPSGSTELPVLAGDLIQIRVFQNTGAAVNTAASQANVFVKYRMEPNFILYQAITGPGLTQTKYLSTNKTSTGVMADLSFNNLEVGRSYKIFGLMSLAHTASDTSVVVDLKNGTTVLTQFAKNPDSGDTSGLVNMHYNLEFIADSTTITFDATTASAAGFVEASGSKIRTWAQLVETQGLVTTSKWT